MATSKEITEKKWEQEEPPQPKTVQMELRGHLVGTIQQVEDTLLYSLNPYYGPLVDPKTGKLLPLVWADISIREDFVVQEK